MPVHTVNLDAMIRRDDFEIEDNQQAPTVGGNFKLSELEHGSIVLQMLRKPDFQRETMNWPPEKIAELIRGFVDGDLIPSVIMWRSQKSGNIFVVDGAHRLSAFIAWLHDDYGDGDLSRKFFGDTISPEQEKAASLAREAIRKLVGSYQELRRVAQEPALYSPIQVSRAKNAGILPIEVQWVKGDASKAEASFFTINQSATAIHPTELRLIKARRKPNAIAARAIMHAGTGHKYWSEFPEDVRANIERIARDIYGVLFDPSLRTPIKTLDLPVAGRGYSADSLSLVVEFINVANNIKTEAWLGESSKRSRGRRNEASPPRATLPDDEDGATTIEYLKAVMRIASRMSGTQPRSLGLHPAVYFYSATGRYQPATFLTMVAYILEVEQAPNGFFDFTRRRARFEEFLVKYRHFINQIVRAYGSGTRSLDPILTMYRMIHRGIMDGHADADIAESLSSHEKLRLLKITGDEELLAATGRDFSAGVKSAAFLNQALQSAVTCSICGARIHVKGITVDHKVRREDGGKGAVENAQIAHPYCNSGYKEQLAAAQRTDITAAPRKSCSPSSPA